MFQTKLLILQALSLCHGDWVSEWMIPVQDEFGIVKDFNEQMNYDDNLKKYEDQELNIPYKDDPILSTSTVNYENESVMLWSNDLSSATLQAKLVAALQKAQKLSTALRDQILVTSDRETALKEDIVTGRSGVTLVTVYTLTRAPRSYMIRDGVWTTCHGLLQPQYGSKGLECIGVEITSKSDPCVFQSVTKYETIPTRRRSDYVEEDYLCLKKGFNSTIEKYYSVPKTLINDTCKNGVVKTLEDNIDECGIRVLSKYVYYPRSTAHIPLEYCETSTVGTRECHFLAAWHLSNTTIERFEYLTDEPTFKDYFIRG